MMKVLFISPEFPCPPSGGGRKRVCCFLKHLSRLGADIELLTFATGAQLEYKNSLDGFCSKVHLVEYKEPSFSAKIKRICSLKAYDFDDRFFQKLVELAPERFAVIHLIKSQMAEYVYPLKKKRALPIIIDLWACGLKGSLGDFRYEENIFRKMIIFSRIPRYAISDFRMYRSFNNFTVASEECKKYILERHPGKNVCVAPSGIEPEDIRPFQEGLSPVNTLIFTGDMSFFPNVDAMLYFAKDIYPSIKRQIPEVKLYIVGKDPGKEILRLGQDDHSIIVTGYVEDIYEYLAKSSIYVVPLRCGSGIRTKILEAMASGLAVVATDISVEGIKVSDGINILLAKTSADFVSKAAELLRNPARAKNIADHAKDLVGQEYLWETSAKKIFDFYQDLL
jgi:glycosyltransferase involved in cell wall biosynthesis